MTALLQRISPSQISGFALLGGFGLMLTEPVAAKVVGAGLILLAFFVPFLQLSTKTGTDGAATTPRRGDTDPRTASVQPDVNSERPSVRRGFAFRPQHGQRTTLAPKGSAWSIKERNGAPGNSKGKTDPVPKSHQGRVKGVPAPPSPPRDGEKAP
jgi:hypothetical protein